MQTQDRAELDLVHNVNCVDGAKLMDKADGNVNFYDRPGEKKPYLISTLMEFHDTASLVQRRSKMETQVGKWNNT